MMLNFINKGKKRNKKYHPSTIYNKNLSKTLWVLEKKIILNLLFFVIII
jgi:hypothetical protein